MISVDIDYTNLQELLDLAQKGYIAHIEWFLKHKNTALKQLAVLLTSEIVIANFLSKNPSIPKWMIVFIYIFLAFLSLILAYAGSKSCQRSYLASLEYVAFFNKLMWIIEQPIKAKLFEYFDSKGMPLSKDKTFYVPRYLDDISRHQTTQSFVNSHLGFGYNFFKRPKNTYFWAVIAIWSLGMMGFFIGLICVYMSIFSPNKALHLTAIPLRSIAAGELGRYA